LYTQQNAQQNNTETKSSNHNHAICDDYATENANKTGLPIFHPRNRFRDLLSPSPNLPISSIVRDPFWWDVDDLVPFRATSVPRASSPVARDSYLSPVKNRYLWSKHPARPLTRKYYLVPYIKIPLVLPILG